MNNAIIFIKDEQEKQLSKAPYLGGNLLLHVINEIRKLDNLRNIYIVGTDSDIPGCISNNKISEVMEIVSKEQGKILMVSPLYPDLNADDFKKLQFNLKLVEKKEVEKADPFAPLTSRKAEAEEAEGLV